MPKRKDSQVPVSDADPDQSVDAAVTNNAKILRDRLSLEYDGVMGKPADWIPENFQRDFQAARNRLLDAGYTANKIRGHMAKEMRRSRYALRNPLTPIWYGGFAWPLEVLSDVLTLAHVKRAVRLGREKGLAFLTDETHAKKVNKGERYGQHQSSNAKRPRGKIREGGPTISQIIGRLSRRQGQSAKDLWDAFYGELDEQGLNPQYMSTGSIAFDFKMERKPITFGTFEKTVSQYRTGKKKLP